MLKDLEITCVDVFYKRNQNKKKSNHFWKTEVNFWNESYWANDYKADKGWKVVMNVSKGNVDANREKKRGFWKV